MGKKGKRKAEMRSRWKNRNNRKKRLLRPQTIDGLSIDEFIARNADPIWLHQNEQWHLMPDDYCFQADHSE